MIAREKLIDTARSVYRSYGYSPIDTPALEYSEILLGKGGEESNKQLYRFTRGKRDIALRFDLTVPLARFAAQHAQQIGIPFKRYHIASVWRGERPQKGRYREFMQCDFDTVGTDSNTADIETLFVIHDLMVQIGFSEFTIRVNNRAILNGLLEKLELTEKSADVLRVLDKLPKIGREAVAEEMVEKVGTSTAQAASVLDMASLSGTNDEVLDQLDSVLAESEQGRKGVASLRELFDCVSAAGIPAERVRLDVAIARGLDYYTGTIFETFLTALPGIGSVCSGGRYDNLVGTFSKESLPGVGASLGLDRLLAAMDELGMLKSESTPADVLITQLAAGKTAEYLRLGRLLRAAGIATEVYPELRKIARQFKYADQKGFPLVIVAGEDEFSTGNWQVKNLLSGEQVAVPEAELADHIHTILTTGDDKTDR